MCDIECLLFFNTEVFTYLLRGTEVDISEPCAENGITGSVA